MVIFQNMSIQILKVDTDGNIRQAIMMRWESWETPEAFDLSFLSSRFSSLECNTSQLGRFAAFNSSPSFVWAIVDEVTTYVEELLMVKRNRITSPPARMAAHMPKVP